MTYILMWNPEISSTKIEDWKYWMEHFPFIKPNWSVYEWQESDHWDAFYIVKVGNDRTGVVMKGHFSSLPYRGNDWSGKGRKVYYRDLDIDYIMDPEKGPMISTNELEEAIPGFEWRGGHSGRLLSEDDAEKMDKLWASFKDKNADYFDKQDTLRNYVIEPSSLAKVQNSEIWENVICDWMEDNGDMYTDAASHDCVNLSFNEDYVNHEFRLKEWFMGGVLDIVCKGMVKLKMDLDNGYTFMSEFGISEAGPDLLYLKANGIQIWCQEIIFEGIDNDFEDDWVPVSI